MKKLLCLLAIVSLSACYNRRPGRYDHGYDSSRFGQSEDRGHDHGSWDDSEAARHQHMEAEQEHLRQEEADEARKHGGYRY